MVTEQNIIANKRSWKIGTDLLLESGRSIQNPELTYHTFGELNDSRDNVIWVFHALTANSNVYDWWTGLFGENSLMNPDRHFIICVNTIGSPYGSTAPQNFNFPFFTVRDIVKAQLLLAKHLNITDIFLLMGGSFGGSQALEFAHSFQGRIQQMALIACATKESAWGIAIHQAQRLALQADPTFGRNNGGSKGLGAARAIGLLSYRTGDAFVAKQTDTDDRIENHRAASYINYQAKKLVNRFSALSYYYLINCLDTHNLGRERGGVESALSEISVRSLIIGIDSDQLLPVYLQKEIANGLPHGKYVEIQSDFGHDGFLIETEQIVTHLLEFINND
ncbi:MAG: homoserine O-acetyltransferase [Cyclobacteriaceae bacterium]